jgi:hypothetical protein
MAKSAPRATRRNKKTATEKRAQGDRGAEAVSGRRGVRSTRSGLRSQWVTRITITIPQQAWLLHCQEKEPRIPIGGMDTRRLQHFLGHASITNTVRYTAMSPKLFHLAQVRPAQRPCRRLDTSVGSRCRDKHFAQSRSPAMTIVSVQRAIGRERYRWPVRLRRAGATVRDRFWRRWKRHLEV